MKRKITHGFTLVEIAIVLVVIGLLIGGVLRGNELLNSARANSVISQQKSMQTAFYGFVDRFKIVPGDMNGTQALLINNFAAPAVSAGDGNVMLEDSAAFFNNLAQAGFITCSACSSAAIVTPGATGVAATYIPPAGGLNSLNSPVNVFGQPVVFYFNNGATAGSTALAGSSTAGSISFLGASNEGGKPLLLTGGALSSSMLAEIDRKTDDGDPSGGQFRYTDIVAITAVTGASIFVDSTASNKCFSGTAPTFTWTLSPPGICQGASML